MKTQQGEEIVSIVLDASFWANMKKIVNICKPILKVLRLTDREGATMGLIYECTQHMIEEIKHIEDVDHIMLDEIRGICMQRWSMLQSPLHAIGFILHPIWREKIQDIDDKVNTSWMETIMRYSNGDVHLCGVLLDAIWLIELKKKVHFKFLRQTIQLECIMQLSGGKHLEHALQTKKDLQFMSFLKIHVHLLVLVKEIGAHSH